MGTDERSQKVIAIIGQIATVPADKITLDTKLEDLGIESLDRVEIAIELETEFDIRISDSAAGRFATVGDVTRHIDEALAEAAP